MAHTNDTTKNASACYACKHCGSDLAIAQEPGGDFSYQCQNQECKWACDVRCVQHAARVRNELDAYARLWDAQADAQRLELERYAAEWDAEVEAVRATPQAERAATKAAYHIASGLTPRRSGNLWLVPSSRRNTAIYQVSEAGCTCEAAQHGRMCWHVAAAQIAEAQMRQAA